MNVDAEKETGAVLSWEGDNRVTKVGNILRKTHLDELPQLINVVKGEMSFVGPRPERPEMTSEFNKEITNYKLRENVCPGITGLAQISLPYDATAAEKLEFDLLYIANKNSILLYTFIVITTIKKMIFWRSFKVIGTNLPHYLFSKLSINVLQRR